jgi:hypothetical protein
MTREQLATCSREQRLAWFAKQIISVSWDGDVDATDVHEFAYAAGLVHSETLTSDTDTAGISNSEYLEIGDTFYREARDLIEALPCVSPS